MFSPCNADARFACIVGHRQTGHWNIVNCRTSDLLTPLIPDCSALRAPAILKNIRNSLIFL